MPQQVNRLYFVRVDENNNPQINSEGKFITYKAPQSWNSTFAPNNLIELGFKVVLLNSLSELGQDCGLVPLPTDGAPTIKQLSIPAYVGPNTLYSWSFLLDDIATPYQGTTLKNIVLAPSAPTWLGITSASVANGIKTWTIAGQVPVGYTGNITIPVIVTGSNNISTSGSFSAEKKPTGDIYAYISIFNNNTSIRIGPDKANAADLNPWISVIGQDYVGSGRTPMETFKTNPIVFLDNQRTYFQKTLTDLPRGNRSMVAKIEHLGQTKYLGWVSIDNNADFRVAILDENPYSEPFPDQVGTWTAYSTVNLLAGQSWTAVIPGSSYTGTSGVKSIEIVGGAPENFTLSKTNGVYTASYVVPSNESGLKEISLKLTENSNQVLTNKLRFNVEAVNMTAVMWGISANDYWAGLAPTKQPTSAQPRVRLVRTPDQSANLAWQTMDSFDFNANNQLFPYRKTGYNFATAGETVVAFEKDNLVRYAVFNHPFSGVFPLTLSATEPTPAANVTYFVNVPGAGVNEGGSDYLYAFRRANGVDTAHSGGKFKSDNLGAGVSINESTGYVQVASNTKVGDNFSQSFYYEVNGSRVFNGSFMVNDTTGTTNPVDNTDQSGETVIGYFDSVNGPVLSLTVTAATSLDEGAATQITASATTASGYTETDMTKMNVYLAAATGDFAQATAQVVPEINGVKLGRNGYMTANVNTTMGDSRYVRVKVEYGGQEVTKTINIIDKTTTQTAAFSQIWIRYNSTINGTHNFSLVVVGNGSFEYQTYTDDGFGWTGTILTSASAPTVQTNGTSISRIDSQYQLPRRVEIRMANQPSTSKIVEIPSTAGVWTKVYQA